MTVENSCESSQARKDRQAGLETLLRGSGIVGLGMVAKVALVFMTEVLAARVLLPERYGLLTWALFLTNIICMVSGLGLSTASRRFIPIFQSRGNLGAVRGTVRLSLVLSVMGGLLGALFLFVGNEWLSVRVLGDARESAVLLVFVFAVPLWNLQKTMLAAIGGFKLPRCKVLIEDLLTPFGFLCVILFAWLLGWKEVPVARGYVLVYFISALLSTRAVFKWSPYKESAGLKPEYRTAEILGFSWPLIFSEPIGKCTGLIDILILGALAVAYDVGLYRAASDMALVITLVLLCFAFMYIPLVSKLADNREHDKWQDMNARVARWSMLIGFPIFATFFFFSKEVIQIVYGKNFVEAAPILRILAVAYFGHTMVGFTAGNLIAAGMTRVQFMIFLTGFVTNIAGNFFLIPIYGVTGAAIASLLSLWALNGISLVVMKWKLNLFPFTRLYGYSIGCLLVSAYFGSWLLHSFVISSNILVVSLFLMYCFFVMVFLSFLSLIVDDTDRTLIHAATKKLVSAVSSRRVVQQKV